MLKRTPLTLFYQFVFITLFVLVASPTDLYAETRQCPETISDALHEVLQIEATEDTMNTIVENMCSTIRNTLLDNLSDNCHSNCNLAQNSKLKELIQSVRIIINVAIELEPPIFDIDDSDIHIRIIKLKYDHCDVISNATDTDFEEAMNHYKNSIVESNNPNIKRIKENIQDCVRAFGGDNIKLNFTSTNES